MIQRLAITAAGIAAVIVLTVGLVAAGFGPRAAQEDSAFLAAESPADPAVAVEPAPEFEVVYVRPAPTPETVVVARQVDGADWDDDDDDDDHDGDRDDDHDHRDDD